MKAIFIGGTGRSGTTVLKRIFAKAPGASTLGDELHVHVRKGGLLDICRRGRALDAAELATVTKRYSRADARAASAITVANEAYANTGDGTHAAIALLRRAFGTGGVPVEDTPDNMWWASELAELLPDALFVHMVRHPLYVLESTHRMHWGRPTHAGTAAYLAESYRRCLASEGLGDRCLRIKHEQLCDDTRQTLDHIARFTGLDVRRGHALVEASAARGRTISHESRAAMPPLVPFLRTLGYE